MVLGIALLGTVLLPVAGQADDSTAPPQPVAQESLAWLVPPDAALVVEATHLASAAQRFHASRLGQRWRSFPPIERWWEQNREHALRMADEVGRYLQVPPHDIWRDVLGHRVLLAAWPPRIDEDDSENTARKPADDSDRPPRHRPPASTLLILQSPQPETLARLVEGFCTAQERTEHVVWTSLEYGGAVIRCGESERGQDLYVVRIDDTAVVSDTRRVVEAVVDLRTGRTGREQSLAATAAYREAAAELPHDVAVRLFIPAPAWTASLAADAARSTGRAQQEKRQFLALWQGMQFLSLTLQLDERFAVQALARFDRSRWPEPARSLWSAITGPTPLAQEMPSDCMLAVAGRIDLALIAEALGTQTSEPQRFEGWQLVRNALAVLGGDFGLYLVEDQGQSPAVWVATASILPRWKDPSAASTPGEFLQVGLEQLLGIVASQQPELSVQRQVSDGHTLLVVEHAPALGPVRQVALAVTGERVWAATSAAAIDAALATGVEQLAAAKVFSDALPEELSPPSGFLFLNAAKCRALLDERRDELVASLSQARQTDAQRVGRGLQQLYAVLELCDHALAATQFTEGSARLAITISAD